MNDGGWTIFVRLCAKCDRGSIDSSAPLRMWPAKGSPNPSGLRCGAFRGVADQSVHLIQWRLWGKGYEDGGSVIKSLLICNQSSRSTSNQQTAWGVRPAS